MLLGVLVMLVAILCADRPASRIVIPTPPIPSVTVTQPDVTATVTTTAPDTGQIILQDTFTSGPTLAVLSDPLHIPEYGTWIPYSGDPTELTLDGSGYAVGITVDSSVPTRNYGANAVTLAPPQYIAAEDTLRLTIEFLFPNAPAPGEQAILETGLVSSALGPSIGFVFCSAGYNTISPGDIEYVINVIVVPPPPDPPVFQDVLRVTLPGPINIAKPFQRVVITLTWDGMISAQFTNIVDGTDTPIADIAPTPCNLVPRLIPPEESVVACYNNALTPSIVPKVKFFELRTV